MAERVSGSGVSPSPFFSAPRLGHFAILSDEKGEAQVVVLIPDLPDGTRNLGMVNRILEMLRAAK